jgi:hypothetical protein
MEMEQMMVHLLAEIKTNQKYLEEEIKAGQALLKEKLLAKIETNQEGTEAYQEKAVDKLYAHHERKMVRMDSQPVKMEVVVDVFKRRLKKIHRGFGGQLRKFGGCNRESGSPL